MMRHKLAISFLLQMLLMLFAVAQTNAATPNSPSQQYCAPLNVINNGAILDATPVMANWNSDERCLATYGDLFVDGPLFPDTIVTSGASFNFTIPANIWLVYGNRVYSPVMNEVAAANQTSYYWLDIYGIWRITTSNTAPTINSKLEYSVVANTSGVISYTAQAESYASFVGGVVAPSLTAYSNLNLITEGAGTTLAIQNVTSGTTTNIAAFNANASGQVGNGAISWDNLRNVSISNLLLGTPLTVAQGGTGTGTPSITGGTNIQVTGTYGNAVITDTLNTSHFVTNNGTNSFNAVNTFNGATTFAAPVTVNSTETLSNLETNSTPGQALNFTGTSAYLSFSGGSATTPAQDPQFGTRSNGTAIVLYPSEDGADADYAIGVGNGDVWFSTASTGQLFKFFGGKTNTATIDGSGDIAGLGYGAFGLTGANTEVQIAASAISSTIPQIQNTGTGGLLLNVPTSSSSALVVSNPSKSLLTIGSTGILTAYNNVVIQATGSFQTGSSALSGTALTTSAATIGSATTGTLNTGTLTVTGNSTLGSSAAQTVTLNGYTDMTSGSQVEYGFTVTGGLGADYAVIPVVSAGRLNQTSGNQWAGYVQLSSGTATINFGPFNNQALCFAMPAGAPPSGSPEIYLFSNTTSQCVFKSTSASDSRYLEYLVIGNPN